jgi:hypothetical protein
VPSPYSRRYIGEKIDSGAWAVSYLFIDESVSL